MQMHSYELSNYTCASANVVMVKDVLFMIFSICTSVRNHIAFLLLWVHTNACELIRTNSFVLVFVHPY